MPEEQPMRFTLDVAGFSPRELDNAAMLLAYAAFRRQARPTVAQALRGLADQLREAADNSFAEPQP